MKYFQNLVQQIKDIVDFEFGIIDETGLILASSEGGKAGKTHLDFSSVIESKKEVVVLQDMTYQKVFTKGKLDFVTYIAACDKDSLKHLSLITVNVINFKQYHEEKYDKNNFMKNIITDNMLPGDIPSRAKELHLAYSISRVVYLIKTEKSKELHSYEIILSMFPGKTKDFVVMLDSETTALIKELKSGDDSRQIEKTARIIIDTISTESMVKASVGIGSVVDNLRDVARSFKEAQTALFVGGMFESEKPIINYNSLGIGRLIYQLPTTLCKLFLKEVFTEGAYESMDTETFLTIQKFFENNLNISETSRQLYVHRNTLVYRLDKIQKITNLDLRKLDDAITFKVALMVKKYLDRVDKML